MRGKREMKRNYTPFAAGMVTMALLIGLIASSFAANGGGEETAEGGAAPAQIGVGIFLKQQIAPGETLVTERGGAAPKVLSFSDSKGETHYYIEATAVAELFDVTYGVNFHEEANQLEFGAEAIERHDKDGNAVKEWDELGTAQRQDFILARVTDGETGETVLQAGGVDVTTSGGYTFSASKSKFSDDPELQKDIWARHKKYCQAKPEYGTTGGMFTEVDPSEVNLATLCGVAMKDKEFSDSEEIEHTFSFASQVGKYAAITLENTGAAEAEIQICRPNAIGTGFDSFTAVYLPAGAKMMRAFRIDENKPLENQLRLTARPLGEGGVHLKLTEELYRSGN